MIHDINFISLSYFIVCKINVRGNACCFAKYHKRTHWFEETEILRILRSSIRWTNTACKDCWMPSTFWALNKNQEDSRVLMTPCGSARPRTIIVLFCRIRSTRYPNLSKKRCIPRTTVNTLFQWMLCCVTGQQYGKFCDTGWLTQPTIQLLGTNVWFKKKTSKILKNKPFKYQKTNF